METRLYSVYKIDVLRGALNFSALNLETRLYSVNGVDKLRRAL